MSTAPHQITRGPPQSGGGPSPSETSKGNRWGPPMVALAQTHSSPSECNTGQTSRSVAASADTNAGELVLLIAAPKDEAHRTFTPPT